MRMMFSLPLAAVMVAAPAFAVDLTLPQVVGSPARTPHLVARDAVRHPIEELAFFGVKPNATVVEIWPGGGYWTEILAPYLHDHGTYYLAMGPRDGDRTEQHFAMSPQFHSLLAAHPDIYGRVRLTEFGAGHLEPVPPGSADVVLTFRNLHNWMEAGDAPAMLSALHRALKPGGILGVEDHRGTQSRPQDPRATDGYVREDYAKALIEKAGFTFAGSSEIDANPRDTKTWPKGVWTLPPTLALGATDRAKYQAVGEADNFVMKFRND